MMATAINYESFARPFAGSLESAVHPVAASVAEAADAVTEVEVLKSTLRAAGQTE